MTWDAKALEELKAMYNAGKTDEYMAKYFNTTVMAIARMRSTCGLVSSKRGYHKRKQKAVIPKPQTPELVLHYLKDGTSHFMQCPDGDMNVLRGKAQLIMRQNNIKEVTILKPVKKLVMQAFTEIDL